MVVVFFNTWIGVRKEKGIWRISGNVKSQIDSSYLSNLMGAFSDEIFPLFARQWKLKTLILQGFLEKQTCLGLKQKFGGRGGGRERRKKREMVKYNTFFPSDNKQRIHKQLKDSSELVGMVTKPFVWNTLKQSSRWIVLTTQSGERCRFEGLQTKATIVLLCSPKHLCSFESDALRSSRNQPNSSKFQKTQFKCYLNPSATRFSY